MTHSPGPWRWKTDLEAEACGTLLDRDGSCVCDFGESVQYYPTEGAPPNAADAALIAAAPEMLEMLRDCHDLFVRENKPLLAAPIAALLKRIDERRGSDPMIE